MDANEHGARASETTGDNWMSQHGQAAEQTVQPATGRPTGPYVPSIISGVLMVAAAVLIGLAQLTDFEVDYGLLLPVGMVATGVLLVVGALVAVLRGR
ncbi:MAG TPA: hypothetical protein VFX33_13755 [Actinomycetales bacterium]|nr:hypothetical protein [Actinomycetales bacterium]